MGTAGNRIKTSKRRRDQMGLAEPSTGKAAGDVNGALDNPLKKLLQSKILTARQSRGLGDIVVDFKPKAPQPPSEEEKMREEKRKESNRMSADRCRKKSKEDNARAEKMLKEEQERHDLFLEKESKMLKEKMKLLDKLQNDYGVPLNVIEQTLSAITVENKSLGSASDTMSEDQQSVFYLQNSEHSHSEASSSSDTSETQTYHQYRHTESMCLDGYVSELGSDDITGSDVNNHEWETSSSVSSSESMELTIIDTESLENSIADSEGCVTVYICLGGAAVVDGPTVEYVQEELVEAPDDIIEERTYTNL